MGYEYQITLRWTVIRRDDDVLIVLEEFDSMGASIEHGPFEDLAGAWAFLRARQEEIDGTGAGLGPPSRLRGPRKPPPV